MPQQCDHSGKARKDRATAAAMKRAPLAWRLRCSRDGRGVQGSGSGHNEGGADNQQQELFIVVTARLAAGALCRPALRGKGRRAGRSGGARRDAAARLVDPRAQLEGRASESVGHAGHRRVLERDPPQGGSGAGRQGRAGALPRDLRRDALRLRQPARGAADEPARALSGLPHLGAGAGRHRPHRRDLDAAA